MKVSVITRSALAALVAFSAAAELRGADRTIRLEEALRLALEHDEAIVIQRESLAAADAALSGAAGAYDPRLEVAAGWRESNPPVNSSFSGAPAGRLAPTGESSEGSVTLEQLLPTGATLGLRALGNRDDHRRPLRAAVAGLRDAARSRAAPAAAAQPRHRRGATRPPGRRRRPRRRRRRARAPARRHGGRGRARLLDPGRGASGGRSARGGGAARRGAALGDRRSDRDGSGPGDRDRPAARRARAPARRAARLARGGDPRRELVEAARPRATTSAERWNDRLLPEEGLDVDDPAGRPRRGDGARARGAAGARPLRGGRRTAAGRARAGARRDPPRARRRRLLRPLRPRRRRQPGGGARRGRERACRPSCAAGSGIPSTCCATASSTTPAWPWSCRCRSATARRAPAPRSRRAPSARRRPTWRDLRKSIRAEVLDAGAALDTAGQRIEAARAGARGRRGAARVRAHPLRRGALHQLPGAHPPERPFARAARRDRGADRLPPGGDRARAGHRQPARGTGRSKSPRTVPQRLAEEGPHEIENGAHGRRDGAVDRRARHVEVPPDPGGDRAVRELHAAARGGDHGRRRPGVLGRDAALDRLGGRRAGRHGERRSARHRRADRLRVGRRGAPGRAPGPARHQPGAGAARRRRVGAEARPDPPRAVDRSAREAGGRPGRARRGAGRGRAGRRPASARSAPRSSARRIRAPFAGRLGIRQVNVGQYVQSGDPIVPLQALDPIYVDFDVPQQAVPAVAVGRDGARHGRRAWPASSPGRSRRSTRWSTRRRATCASRPPWPTRTASCGPGMFVEAHMA